MNVECQQVKSTTDPWDAPKIKLYDNNKYLLM